MKVNGSLVFDASSASEIQNLRVQKLAGGSVPAYTSADTGRVIFVTTSGGSYAANTLYYGSAGANNWVALATGGNAAALQSEVDAIETSLGAIVDGGGIWQVGAVTGPGNIATATSLTGLLQALSDYANENNTFAELDDVLLTGLSANQFAQYNGAEWVNHTLVAADLSDVTATAAELNILDGATLTVTELNYVDGVTSAIQGQLDNKQAIDAGLTSLSALSGTGIIVQTADNVFAARTLVAPAAGITISDPAGIAGNPTFALAGDLAALEGLTGTGYVVRTGDGTATTRSLVGVDGNTVITNGSGVSSDTTIDLAEITQAATGSFVKVTLDDFGRVTGNTAVVTSDITALVDATYVNVAGDSMTGTLAMGGNRITGLGAPTGAGDATTKSYVDSAVAGLTWEAPVDDIVADTTARDALTPATGDRAFVTADNTIYTYDGASWGTGEVVADGGAFFNRDNDAGYTWTGTALVQFAGTGSINPGIGLSQSGNVFNVNLGAGIAQLPSDEVGVDLYNATTGGLILSTDGTTRSTDTGAALHILTGGASGLAQSAAGLYIAPTGVTNAMLVNDGVGLNGDAGTSTLDLGQTLEIVGDSVQGVDTSVTGQTVTISASDASDSQKGVASFTATEFVVTAGNVALGTVANSNLANSVITITGTAGSDAVALGESLAIVASASGIVSTQVTANQVAISVRDATTSLKGAASFSATDFVVTAGDVALVAKDLTAADDVADAAAPTAGHVLAGNGTEWTNKKVYHLDTVAVAATSWTVNHGIGQQFCVVTIVDATDEVVIPQSITFDSANQLTVTFNTAIAGKAVVMGMNLA